MADNFEDYIERKEKEVRMAKMRKAVALGYDLERDPAPRVIATGKGAVADAIVALAEKHDIAIHKDENLVEVLSALELDSVIPMEAYMAVAEILNYLYRTNQAKRS